MVIGATASIAGSGSVAVRASTVGRAIVVGDGVVATALTLSAAEFARILSGHSSVTVGQSGMTGNITTGTNTIANNPTTFLTGGTIVVGAGTTLTTNAATTFSANDFTISSAINGTAPLTSGPPTRRSRSALVAARARTQSSMRRNTP
jgi:hypothetical protein